MVGRGFVAAVAMALATGTAAADAVEVVGSSLTLRLDDGRVLTGAAVSGQEIDIDTLHLRIRAVHPGEGQAPWLYDLHGHDGDAWRPVCTPDANGRRLALFLAGAIEPGGRYVPDPQRLSVTCTSGALGKCLLAGYQPAGQGLPQFQACLRMFRADYCGDGRSWTKDGTVIDVFDPDGIQTSTQTQWPLEAAWGPDGAICVHHTRVPARLSMAALREACPKALDIAPEQCNASAAGALVFNRSVQAR